MIYLDSPIYSKNNLRVFVAVPMQLTVQGRAKIRYYITLLKKSSAFNVTISQHNFHYLHYQWMLNPIPGCQCATRACGSAVTNVSIWFKKSLFHIGLSNILNLIAHFYQQAIIFKLKVQFKVTSHLWLWLQLVKNIICKTRLWQIFDMMFSVSPRGHQAHCLALTSMTTMRMKTKTMNRVNLIPQRTRTTSVTLLSVMLLSPHLVCHPSPQALLCSGNYLK